MPELVAGVTGFDFAGALTATQTNFFPVLVQMRVDDPDFTTFPTGEHVAPTLTAACACHDGSPRINTEREARAATFNLRALIVRSLAACLDSR